VRVLEPALDVELARELADGATLALVALCDGDGLAALVVSEKLTRLDVALLDPVARDSVVRDGHRRVHGVEPCGVDRVMDPQLVALENVALELKARVVAHCSPARLAAPLGVDPVREQARGQRARGTSRDGPWLAGRRGPRVAARMPTSGSTTATEPAPAAATPPPPAAAVPAGRRGPWGICESSCPQLALAETPQDKGAPGDGTTAVSARISSAPSATLVRRQPQTRLLELCPMRAAAAGRKRVRTVRRRGKRSGGTRAEEPKTA